MHTYINTYQVLHSSSQINTGLNFQISHSYYFRIRIVWSIHGLTKIALLPAEIRKAVRRSVVAGSSFDRFLPPTHPNAQERGDLWARIAMVSVGTSFRVIWSWSKSLN